MVDCGATMVGRDYELTTERKKTTFVNTDHGLPSMRTEVKNRGGCIIEEGQTQDFNAMAAGEDRKKCSTRSRQGVCPERHLISWAGRRRCGGTGTEFLVLPFLRARAGATGGAFSSMYSHPKRHGYHTSARKRSALRGMRRTQPRDANDSALRGAICVCML